MQQPKIVSIDVIIEACVRTQLFKYEDVTVKIVGRRAGRVLEMSLLIFCFGVSVFCVTFMSNKFALRHRCNWTTFSHMLLSYKSRQQWLTL